MQNVSTLCDIFNGITALLFVEEMCQNLFLKKKFLLYIAQARTFNDDSCSSISFPSQELQRFIN